MLVKIYYLNYIKIIHVLKCEAKAKEYFKNIKEIFGNFINKH